MYMCRSDLHDYMHLLYHLGYRHIALTLCTYVYLLDQTHGIQYSNHAHKNTFYSSVLTLGRFGESNDCNRTELCFKSSNSYNK